MGAGGALASQCQRSVSVDRSSMEYRADEFIIHYALTGKNKLLPLQEVIDDVPGVVRDAALQLTAMRDMLTSLDFQHPLESKRYRAQGATHILVRFQAFEKGTGAAFDEVARLPSGECVLTIHISSKHRSDNLTPAHEYFHLVQYGYNMFKRSWYLEGMARWSENVLARHQSKLGVLPGTVNDLEALFQSGYRAVSTWYALIDHCDDSTPFVRVPEHLSSLAYRTGKPVVADTLIPGANFIRRVLETYDALDDEVSEREGLPEHRWPEKVQRDSSHDMRMWQALAAICAKDLNPANPSR